MMANPLMTTSNPIIMRRTFVFVVVFAALNGCSSAGPSLHPVTGTVLLKDKRPVAGAIIEFVSENGTGARGKTDADGRFQLTTAGQQGAVVGKYQIVILPMLVTDGAAAHVKSHHAALVIHPKYAKLETSGLKREVVAGPNVFTFELDTASTR
jgi:hypothetical protein